MFVALILLANIKIMFELIAILPLNICRRAATLRTLCL